VNQHKQFAGGGEYTVRALSLVWLAGPGEFNPIGIRLQAKGTKRRKKNKVKVGAFCRCSVKNCGCVPPHTYVGWIIIRLNDELWSIDV
jgi:hypothetical protein